MDKISVAIVGLGRIASFLEDDKLREKPCTHAGAVTANGDCVLIGGMDINAERREAFKARWGCPVYSDAARMLLETKPRILHIATHPDSHLQYAALAEKYRVPVVVCEKPLADTVYAAKKIAAIHRRGVTKTITNHERRYSSNYQQIKTMITDGRYGMLQSIKGTLYMGQNRRLLDILWHDGTHCIDAFAFLADGAPIHKTRSGDSLTAKTGTAFLAGEIHRNPSPSHGVAKVPFLQTNWNIPFVLEIGSNRDHLVFEIECSLERGRFRIGNGIYEIWESAESPYAEGFRSLKRIPSVFTGATGYFTNMVSDAVACVLEPELIPVSSAEDGLAVITYLASIQKW
jgi:predicted dehydrogenase